MYRKINPGHLYTYRDFRKLKEKFQALLNLLESLFLINKPNLSKVSNGFKRF